MSPANPGAHPSARPASAPPRRAGPSKPGEDLVDVHISQGLTDAYVRCERSQYVSVLLVALVCGREDVVFRGEYPTGERTVVIRGEQPIDMEVVEYNSAKNLPKMQLMTLDALTTTVLGHIEASRQGQ